MLEASEAKNKAVAAISLDWPKYIPSYYKVFIF